jgi:hypothetical protein
MVGYFYFVAIRLSFGSMVDPDNYYLNNKQCIFGAILLLLNER